MRKGFLLLLLGAWALTEVWVFLMGLLMVAIPIYYATHG